MVYEFASFFSLELSYLMRKLVHQFAESKHMKMSTTNLFNVHQGTIESMMKYLVEFNEAIIKIVHSKKEMFVRAFQNGLRSGHFIESFT